ncbi:TonB family protein [Pseudoteredinibacter isoporae]|uniref:TonB family protein n=1 Tax=Pseudoteredinibacter isoporae TaxID=570281 RepID=A0A7X0JSB2_9GAMM|nr:TonB family protein [Pseudoteredinibacter isoporae]NHO86945.1 TonB family protein [Pseudoteredinibacter isoporae]NIB24602.1 TonB family protein [Pseudoteredinibacter isoporae]
MTSLSPSCLLRRIGVYAATPILCLGMSVQSSADQLLNGIASYNKLGKERFLAGLYLTGTSNDPSAILNSSEPQKMEMRVTAKRLSSRSLTKLWIESMAINNPPSVLTEQANAMVQFSKLVKRTLRTGDHLVIHRKGTGTTEISLNGIKLGEINQDGFFKTLLNSWLGSVPFSSSFKSQLLVNGNVGEDLNARFVTITPDAARTEQLAQVINQSQESAAPAQAVSTQQTSAAVPQQQSAPEPEQPEARAAASDIAASTQTEAVIEQPLIAKPNIQLASAEQPTEEAPEPEPASPEQQEQAAIISADELDEEELDEGEDISAELTAEALLNRQLYHSKLVKWAYQHVKYPKRAIVREQQGSVQLELVVDRNGDVRNIEILEASKYATLNRASQRAIEDASPFPPMPETMSQEEFRFTLPIVYRLPD